MFWSTLSVSEVEEELSSLEEQALGIRNRQAVLVNELDKINIAASTGSRSTTEWVTSRFDVSHTTASDLVFAARQLKRHRRIEHRLVNGDLTFDRTVAMLRLALAGADEITLKHSESLDLAGVGRLTARQRRITASMSTTCSPGGSSRSSRRWMSRHGACGACCPVWREGSSSRHFTHVPTNSGHCPAVTNTRGDRARPTVWLRWHTTLSIETTTPGLERWPVRQCQSLSTSIRHKEPAARPAQRSNTDRGSDRTRSRNCCARAVCRSSASTTENRLSPLRPLGRSRRRCGVWWRIVTAGARSRVVRVGIGLSRITSSIGPGAVPTIRRI